MNTCFAVRGAAGPSQIGPRVKLVSSQPLVNGPGATADSAATVTLEPLGGVASLTGAKGTSKGPIRVLIADDHPVVRKGLSACLSKLKQVMIVGEAADGREALRKAKELVPDIVLMDIDMPTMNGLTATELLHKDNPSIKVLVLSMHRQAEYVVRILQSGARGYVLKDASLEELIKAIESVHRNETFFSPDVARGALNQFVNGGEGPRTAQISNRERDVLIGVAEGLSNKEISTRLGVGVRTVETHRERIMRKLNIHSVAGLTKYALQKGLISLPLEQTR
jgi:two-component system nitrate/nitrite response regulator NarL